MGFFLIVLIVVIIIWILQNFSRLCNFLRLVRFSIPLKGPGLKEIIEKIRKGESIIWFEELNKRYGSKFCIWFGKNLSLFITDPKDVKFVLSSNKLLNKSKNYKIMEAWLKRGILTSSGEEWHNQRKTVTPAFHFKILEEFKQPMQDMCNIMIEKLKNHSNGEAFDIYPYITLLALDITCETAMGTSINAQLQATSECREYVSSVKCICHLLHKQIFSLWRRIAFLYRFTDDFKKQQLALNVLYAESKKVLEMRRKILKASNIHNLSEAAPIDEYGIKKRLTFLDILLLAQINGADLNDAQIHVHVDNFLFAGHDTTSSAISFAIYLLSQHKDVQQRAYEEAVSMESKEKEPMRYLEAVIKETLRLYPSVPLYSRTATEDVKIGDLNVPKDTTVIILAFSVHRNEKYYPEPDRFDPERFLVNDDNKNPYAYIPFSFGPRNCIGHKFALLELKVILSIVLRNFELLPVDGFTPKPVAELVLRSKNGIYVRLRKRFQAQ